MPSFSAILPPIISSDIRDSYAALPLDEPDETKALHSNCGNKEHTSARKEYRDLIKQLLIILSLSILFTIIAITVIVTAGSPNCQITPTTVTTPVPAIPQPIFSHPQPDISSLKPIDCGNNPTTARERGCHFDIMSMIWIPHECYDPELTEAFATEKSWEWSLHENGTDLISEEDIRKGDIQNGWVRFEYHITHCLYTWRKVIRQIERGGAPIDG